MFVVFALALVVHVVHHILQPLCKQYRNSTNHFDCTACLQARGSEYDRQYEACANVSSRNEDREGGRLCTTYMKLCTHQATQ